MSPSVFRTKIIAVSNLFWVKQATGKRLPGTHLGCQRTSEEPVMRTNSTRTPSRPATAECRDVRTPVKPPSMTQSPGRLPQTGKRTDRGVSIVIRATDSIVIAKLIIEMSREKVNRWQHFTPGRLKYVERIAWL